MGRFCSPCSAVLCWCLQCIVVVAGSNFDSVLSLERHVVEAFEKATGYEITRHPVKNAGTDANRVLGSLETGLPVESADVELFMRMAELVKPHRVYAVGNAWGYSTIILSSIFPDASVDVIDAGIEGKDNALGFEITRKVANLTHGNVALFQGYSPWQTPDALRDHGKSYEFAFLDGLHSNAQVVLDFMGIYPYLAESVVVVFHDVRLFRLEEGIYSVLCEFPEMRFAYYKGAEYTSWAGTGFMYRGFADVMFQPLHGLQETYRCTRVDGKPRIQMSPKLLNSLCLDGILDSGHADYQAHYVQSGHICCSKSCGTCGGDGCEKRTGGAESCCGSGIRAKCKDVKGPSPCIYDTEMVRFPHRDEL